MARRPNLRRCRLVFQRRFVGRKSDLGTPSKEWQDISPIVQADVQPIKGREEVIAQRLQGVTGYKIIVRSQEALMKLTSTDRAVEIGGAGRIFNLRSVLLPSRRGWIDIAADTGVPT